MGIYCEHFFPWLMEKIGDAPKEVMGRLRKDTLQGVSGKILDIGFGIGFNMLYYPQGVTSVTALDISENMNKRAARFISASPIPVTFTKTKAEKMPFGKGEFDAVVSTMTLCTVDNIQATLKEVKRVLKQDGKFYFLEHVAASKKKDRRLQYLLNPVNKAVFCGCNLNRETEKEIMEAGFELEKIKRFQLADLGWPDFLTSMIQGVGVLH
jgi:ubiquinone/menaquinone biosynthesis C-methylase UbiE